MPQFVLLIHESDDSGLGRPTHWDFMIEIPDAEDAVALRTWALSEEPKAGTTVKAMELAAHRRHYLNYEGPISNNRGTVTRIDRGEYELLKSNDQITLVKVSGDVLNGKIRIEKLEDETRFQFQAHD